MDILMKSRIGGLFISLMLSNAAWAQVQITTGNGNIGPTISEPVFATYNSPYSFQPFGDSSGSIGVTPDVSGDLSTGTFHDAISYTGTVVCPGCSGAVSVSFPMLNLTDSFTMTSATGADVPWTISFSGTPVIAAPNAQIIEGVSLGGNIAGQNLQECFSDGISCSGYGATGANNSPFKMNFSGTVYSGGELTFSASTFGYTQFSVGPTPVSISASMAMDPGIELVVPDGTTVISTSGVFPVTFESSVPEPSLPILYAIGLSILTLTCRKHRG